MNVLTVFAHPGYQPKDVLVQQQKVARADSLTFVAPVRF